MQQNLGNVSSETQPLNSYNDTNPTKTDKDIEGSVKSVDSKNMPTSSKKKSVVESQSKVDQPESGSSCQPASAPSSSSEGHHYQQTVHHLYYTLCYVPIS